MFFFRPTLIDLFRMLLWGLTHPAPPLSASVLRVQPRIVCPLCGQEKRPNP